MIFQFPDLDTLHLAIAGSQIPPAISLAPVEVAFSAEGSLTVSLTESNAPKAMQNALKRLGVASVKSHLSSEVETLSCWPQILPLQKEATLPEGAAQGTVLFELPTSALAEIVSEMLRLGNDRQSYRFLASTQDATDQRVLLKVIGPPYYTLLRALDHLQTRTGALVTGFLERAPRVWVEIGFQHPMIEQLKSSESQMLLVRSPRNWLVLDEKPFQDIYEILDFKLPSKTIEWEETSLQKKLSVPLRLIPGNAADIPEMWVIQENAFERLDELVRDGDDRLMKRLRFAVALTESGKKQVLLRIGPSKLPPPALELPDALKLKPFWKLPNLFLPVGTRLQPTLRRDAVRQLLAPDPGQVVWLIPQADAKFTPLSIDDGAFRPMEDWIDYVIDADRETLTQWMQATEFDFDSFRCSEDGNPVKPSGGGGKGARSKSSSNPEPEAVAEEVAPRTKKKSEKPKTESAEFTSPVVIAPPSELKIKQEQLEGEFLDQEGSLDAPARQALWPELARIYAAQNNSADAAIAWLNVLWESDQPNEHWLGEWTAAEVKSTPTLSPSDLKRYLGLATPSPGEIRAFVAQLLWSCRNGVPETIQSRLPEIHKFLEANEKQLSLRATWLVWLRLAKLEGSDLLSLARVRDRLLQRLLDEGLNAERDLPTFLRFAGLRDSDRMRLVRDRAIHLERAALKWVTLENEGSSQVNRAYVKLIFAFGLARLGDVTLAKDRLEEAGATLRTVENTSSKNGDGKPDPVHLYLFDAFKFRIEQALGGKPHNGPLSNELLDRLDQIDSTHRGTNKTPSLPRYMIDRMREQSRVLDPQEKFSPYRLWQKHGDEISKELSELPDVKKPAELQSRIEKLLLGGPKGKLSPENRIFVLSESIPLAPRISEDFTSKLLLMIPQAIEGMERITDEKWIKQLCLLLERSLFQAAHFDRSELVHLLSDKFTVLLKGKSGEPLCKVIDILAGQCLRSLRKLGMREEIHKLLNVMSAQLTHGKSLDQLRTLHARDWHLIVSGLLQLAGGWLYFGEVDRAIPFLNEAQHTLLEDAEMVKQKQFQEYAKLARTYATVLGLGPVDLALNRIEELFRRMQPLPNAYTTKTHYSRFHLNVVEDVVMSIVSEEFALGPTARRWLDDDEFLVRRRIHSDMKKALSGGGM